jgi:hypothetical protein
MDAKEKINNSMGRQRALNKDLAACGKAILREEIM